MHSIIALWTHPRSISTAFERIMIERKDFHILHEPFSYYYYVNQGKASLEQEFVDPDHPKNYPDIRNYIISKGALSPVFFKDMCSHCWEPLLEDIPFLNRIVNTFLIRNPERAIPSYYAMNQSVTSEEIGLEQLHTIFQAVVNHTGKMPVVVDAADLENDPDGMMNAYCKAIGIPFIQEAMTWEKGHQKKWDIWKKWHKDAAKSTGIQRDLEIFEFDTRNNDHLKRLCDIQSPFYEALHQHRIKPEVVSD